jgi:hypothetical protein
MTKLIERSVSRVQEPIMTPHPGPAREAAGDEKLLVHNWRVARLTQLGIPGPLAEVDADHLDWHQVARLVQHGCPPQLALRIVR